MGVGEACAKGVGGYEGLAGGSVGEALHALTGGVVGTGKITSLFMEADATGRDLLSHIAQLTTTGKPHIAALSLRPDESMWSAAHGNRSPQGLPGGHVMHLVRCVDYREERLSLMRPRWGEGGGGEGLWGDDSVKWDDKAMEACEYQPQAQGKAQGQGGGGYFWLTSAELTLHFTHLYWFEDLSKGGHLPWSLLTTPPSSWDKNASRSPVHPEAGGGGDSNPPFSKAPLWSLTITDDFPTACVLVLTQGKDIVAQRERRGPDDDALPCVGLAVIKSSSGSGERPARLLQRDCVAHTRLYTASGYVSLSCGELPKGEYKVMAVPYTTGARGHLTLSLWAETPGAKLSLLEPASMVVSEEREEVGVSEALQGLAKEADPNPSLLQEDYRFSFQRDLHDYLLSPEDYAASLFGLLDSKGTNMVSGLELERLVLEIGLDAATADTIPMKDMLMKRVCKKAEFVKWYAARANAAKAQ